MAKILISEAEKLVMEVQTDDTMHQVDCTQTQCRNNLIHHSTSEWGCNLKKIMIGPDGICEDFISMEEKCLPTP